MNVILTLVLASMLAAVPPMQLRGQMGQTKQESSVPLKELRNAPTMVTVDNRPFNLSTYPWRDFMPGMWNAGGSPLMIAVKIISADQQPLPTGIRVDRVWVLYGEQSWEVAVRGRIAGQDIETMIKCPNSPVCEVSAQDGPKWGPGIYVDVVVRFLDSEGKEHFLQAPNQFVLSSS